MNEEKTEEPIADQSERWDKVQPAPTPTAPARRILFGADGLRAGWSLLLYLLLAALFAFSLSKLASLTHLLVTPPPQSHLLPTSREVALGESIGCIAFLAAALLMSRIERRPFARYYLATHRLLPNLLAGLACGLLFLSTLVVVLLLTHHLIFESALLHGPPAFARGAAWLVTFSLVGLQEEFLTRGYIQFTLTRGLAGLIQALAPDYLKPRTLAFWTSALLLSVLLFMAGHLANSGETIPGILAVGLAGLTFAFSLWRTGTLWWAIGFHTAWDWSQSFLFGVPDSGTMVANHLLATHPTGSTLLSGGPAGPEGSLFVLPTLLLVCLTLHLTYPNDTSSESSPALKESSS